MANSTKTKKRLKQLRNTVLIGAIGICSIGIVKKVSKKQNDKQLAEIATLVDGKFTSSATRPVYFQVDSIKSDFNNSAHNILGYYNPQKNNIKLVHNQDYAAEIDVATVVHEQKHQDNWQKGFHLRRISLNNVEKLLKHDEVSASLTAFLAMRQEYIKTNDISILEKYRDGEFKGYVDKLKNGKIKCNSTNEKEFSEEMGFLYKYTKDMWDSKYGEIDIYQRNIAKNVNNYINTHNSIDGKIKTIGDAADDEANYFKALKDIYNIGGVDFSQFIKNEKDDVRNYTNGERKDIFKRIKDDENSDLLGTSEFKEEPRKLSDLEKLYVSAQRNLHKMSGNNPTQNIIIVDEWSEDLRVSGLQVMNIPDLGPNSNLLQDTRFSTQEQNNMEVVDLTDSKKENRFNKFFETVFKTSKPR